ncbi:MAG TPA: GAF domain-containing protein [Cytophaga sp.]|nr:GAF domain-containing protein [Cytophaga sp.]
MKTLSVNVPFRYAFSLHWELSFKPYLNFIESQIAESDNVIYKSYLKSIAAILYNNPILLEPIKDWSVLDGVKDLIDLIHINHIPAFGNNHLYAIGTPSSPMNFFSYSDAFKKLIMDEEGTLKLRLLDGFANEEYARRMYQDILHKCYGVTNIAKDPSQTLLRLTDSSEGFKRYFHFITNNQFVHINYSGELPALNPEWVEYANGTIASIKDIDVQLPLDRFGLEGFILFTIKDETITESLNQLSDNVATMHTLSRKDTFIQIKNNTLSLLQKKDLEVGILPLIDINKKIFYHKSFNYSSILFKILQKHLSTAALNDFLGRFIDMCTEANEFPIQIFKETLNEVSQELREYLTEEGVKSFSIIPVFHQQDLVGVIELASYATEQVTPDDVRKIESAMPMFAEFIVYQTNKLHEQMESFIMHNYTAIQSVVEWKFNEIAWNTMQKAPNAKLPDISFKQLTPFYGAIDIKNSSVARQNALRKDSTNHLKKVEKILSKYGDTDTTSQEHLALWKDSIENTFADEQELNLRLFIERASQDLLENYPDAEVDFLHEEEINYEQSLFSINNALKEILDIQEQKLKKNIPVYFDKFRTDGWEYTIYAGQSLSPDIVITPEMILKVKEWELETMLHMGLIAASLHGKIPYRLETTQLILAHTSPLDIRFRADEHRFDVEGSYSIRYEVIKKRIDKVRIRDTEERLTQPNKIAIVYLYSVEIEVYIQAIQTYVQQGLLMDGIEYLELEDLQGVAGLKAIRVTMKEKKS